MIRNQFSVGDVVIHLVAPTKRGVIVSVDNDEEQVKVRWEEDDRAVVHHLTYLIALDGPVERLLRLIDPTESPCPDTA